LNWVWQDRSWREKNQRTTLSARGKFKRGRRTTTTTKTREGKDHETTRSLGVEKRGGVQGTAAIKGEV